MIINVIYQMKRKRMMNLLNSSNLQPPDNNPKVWKYSESYKPWKTKSLNINLDQANLNKT